jgi:hypothetical protein
LYFQLNQDLPFEMLINNVTFKNLENEKLNLNLNETLKNLTIKNEENLKLLKIVWTKKFRKRKFK